MSSSQHFSVGTIGAGTLAQVIAGHAVAAGHHVIFSNSRGPESLEPLASRFGANASAGGLGVLGRAGLDRRGHRPPGTRPEAPRRQRDPHHPHPPDPGPAAPRPHQEVRHDPDGRIFQTARGGILQDSGYNEVWDLARKAALTPAQYRSPLGRHPYDLRHAAVSLWLNSGVPATEVARRAGHGVAVLLKIYAHCIDGQATAANQRIADALDIQDAEQDPGDEGDGDTEQAS